MMFLLSVTLTALLFGGCAMRTVEEMYAIQSVGTEDAYTAIDEDMQIICKNFNAVITMLKSNESIFIDKATSDSVKLFMRNIFQATVNIVYAYGLA